MNGCSECEYHKKRAQLWRDEAYKLGGHELPREPEQGEPKEWVGLTKEEVKNEVEFFFRHSYVQDIDRLFLFVQTIEDKLKEKNT
jgi:hypothetical protein